ncbi:unnamed protein product [Orchesella dallaii]|uniref:Fe2OG dioxygenase domain-containing protein n=1 Tax=Orchesella dallaii TaxID=48710 RepID=A0ABP1QCF7_9HEXA
MGESYVLDCSSILGPVEKVQKQDLANFSKQLGDTLSGVGFAYLTNHGLDLKKIDKFYDVSKEFFDLPKESKIKIRKPPGASSLHGYAAPGDETLNEQAPDAANELREFIDILGHIDTNDVPYFPPELPSFKDAVDEFRLESVKLADKVMRSIALYLGLPEDEIVKRHTHMKDTSVETPTVVRTLMYSPIAKLPDVKISDRVGEIRCGIHCDWLTITLLYQDLVGGLDVQTVSGEWIAATPIENSILLICGDIMEIYSGGRIRATPHRVRIPDDTQLTKKPRQSLLYAPGPDSNQTVEPLLPIPEIYIGKPRSIYGPQSYDKMNAYEWVHRRFSTAATY